MLSEDDPGRGPAGGRDGPGGCDLKGPDSPGELGSDCPDGPGCDVPEGPKKPGEYDVDPDGLGRCHPQYFDSLILEILSFDTDPLPFCLLTMLPDQEDSNSASSNSNIYISHVAKKTIWDQDTLQQINTLVQETRWLSARDRTHSYRVSNIPLLHHSESGIPYAPRLIGVPDISAPWNEHQLPARRRPYEDYQAFVLQITHLLAAFGVNISALQFWKL
ncbi:hypothetical protein F4678DRAFT_460720 [Xylaria arbuscula]|nr:hypothetical protein F4678DRAFT_460720 [Xylaria arbuscula]